jgi:hypothetical protein
MELNVVWKRGCREMKGEVRLRRMRERGSGGVKE